MEPRPGQARPSYATGIGRNFLLRVHVCAPSCCRILLKQIYIYPHASVKALGDFVGTAGAAVAIADVPWHMYNEPQTPFDMQNKIVHNDFNKYSPRSDNESMSSLLNFCREPCVTIVFLFKFA